MCGISAISTVTATGDLAALIGGMAHTQRHRGPDHTGSYISDSGNVGLAHNRLSIVDLTAAGNQPISNEDGTVWISFNGEIYNHKSLRQDLASRGHRFRSSADSEVLVHLYEEQGHQFLDRLRGMFAFAIYDRKRQEIFCARDRVGKKPLAYAQSSWGVAVASELPALKNIPLVDLSPDPVAIGIYLLRRLRHIPDPWTLFRGIRRLPPGHAMVIRSGAVHKIWRYWRLPAEPETPSPASVRGLLDEAVELRSVADVEIAALLSGGVDSTAIVSTMAAQGRKGIRTYALGRDPEDEELARARHAARLFGSQHTEFYFEPQQHHAHYELLLRRYGEPVALLPLLFTYELCRRIRDDGVRVVMAGHGADEIFYGYDTHTRLAQLTAVLAMLPARLCQGLLDTDLALPARIREALVIGSQPERKRKLSLYQDDGFRIWREILHPDAIDSKWNDALAQWLTTWLEDWKPELDYIDEASIIGLMQENCHSVTIAGDLPAMAAAVEVRCPFLDQDLVEYALRTPYRQKVKSLWTARRNKWILKKALAGRVPDEILYAPKRGFGYFIPESDVLRGPWRSHMAETFATAGDLGGILNLSKIRQMKQSFDDGHPVPAMLMAKLYALLQYGRLF